MYWFACFLVLFYHMHYLFWWDISGCEVHSTASDLHPFISNNWKAKAVGCIILAVQGRHSLSFSWLNTTSILHSHFLYPLFVYFLYSGWVLAGTLGHDAWIPVNTVDPSEHGHPSSQASTTAGAGTSGGFFGGGRASDTQQGNPMHDSQNSVS